MLDKTKMFAYALLTCHVIAYLCLAVGGAANYFGHNEIGDALITAGGLLGANSAHKRDK